MICFFGLALVWADQVGELGFRSPVGDYGGASAGGSTGLDFYLEWNCLCDRSAAGGEECDCGGCVCASARSGANAVTGLNGIAGLLRRRPEGT